MSKEFQQSWKCNSVKRYLLGGKVAFILRACNISPTWTFFFKASLFIVLGEEKITDEGNNDELHKIK